MIQAIGLTSVPRRNQPPAVDDLTFEAHSGRVTVLLGDSGAGKTSALRLLLRLDPGRGVALFRGRPLHRIPHPAREIGVLLGDLPGHPARTARGHLRMLSAAVGVPAERADDVLEVVGLSGLADQRLGDFSLGMDRRLGLAAALLGDPHTLVLDEPAQGLSPRETAWLHGLLRGYAEQGGVVLVTSREPKEAARIADRVVTVEAGCLLADQEVADFARTRLRPRVAVRSPLAERLAALLADESHGSDKPVEVVREGGSRISVYGSTCATVGEVAYRNGIVVHRLAEESGDTAPAAPLQRADGRRTGKGEPLPAAAVASARGEGEEGGAGAAPVSDGAGDGAERPVGPPAAGLPAGPAVESVPASHAFGRLPPPGPVQPFRYELRRAAGARPGWVVAAVSLAASLLASVLIARNGQPSALPLFAGWPDVFPLPPAAVGAGLLGALAFGQEFRYPALSPDQGALPRRLGLLGAKLAVSAATALLLALAVLVLDGFALRFLYGAGAAAIPAGWPALVVGWAGLVVGCAWAGLLAAGVFRSALMGLAAVLAMPVVMVPVVRQVLADPSARSIIGLPDRLRSVALMQWPAGVDQGMSAVLRLPAHPVGWALALLLAVLLCAYALTALRGRPLRWRGGGGGGGQSHDRPAIPEGRPIVSDKASIMR
ncbi:ATP-binding cassette domain-containing protein [Streptomyces sp. NPDC050617]|uniref:ATP-binding cassette domain-containing protein n=1 Tax=Streptomyces sp. NPDC050617 TaxID=3154628 RepID=UPI003419AB54